MPSVCLSGVNPVCTTQLPPGVRDGRSKYNLVSAFSPLNATFAAALPPAPVDTSSFSILLNDEAFVLCCWEWSVPGVCHGLRVDSFPQQLFHHFNELKFHSPQKRFPVIPPLSEGFPYRSIFGLFKSSVLTESTRASLLKHRQCCTTCSVCIPLCFFCCESKIQRCRRVFARTVNVSGTAI